MRNKGTLHFNLKNNFHSKTKNIYLHTKSNLMVTMKYIAYKPPYTTQYKNILNNMKRKFKQCRFTSTCINKMNNHHSPQIIEHKKKDHNI